MMGKNELNWMEWPDIPNEMSAQFPIQLFDAEEGLSFITANNLKQQ